MLQQFRLIHGLNQSNYPWQGNEGEDMLTHY